MPTKSNNIGGRGGKRIGAGRKKKSVVEKALNGNPGGRILEVLDIPDLEGVKMPEPHEVLSSTQKDGSVLQAKEIYEETKGSTRAAARQMRRRSRQRRRSVTAAWRR